MRTLLHDACYNYIQLIPLLLSAGADPAPAASDEDGWAPLHILLKTRRCNVDNKVELILNAVAHMDQLNSDGHTPMDFWKSPCPGFHPFAIVNRILQFSLSCFCAQVITRNKIPFKDALLPELQTFVLKHGTKN